jgi:hypothetical protein
MANILSTQYWPEIQRLAELGVPLIDLAERFKVNVKTIYNKCSSEDWLIPKRLKSKLEQAVSRNREITGSDPLLGGKSPAEFSRSLLVETWQDKAEHVRTVAYEAAIQAIEDSSGKIVIESASDLKHAVHVARQATGVLDTDAPQIQLSLFANQDISGPAIMEAQTYDAETLQPVAEDADFWG